MTQETTQGNQIELLTAKEVGQILKCSRSQVYTMRRDGFLPPPVRIFPGQRGMRWLRQDIVDFIMQARIVPERPVLKQFVPIRMTDIR